VTIRGVVYDSLHARPLAGALVAIAAKTAVTDSSGRFTIDGIIPGTYRATAQHDAIDQLGLSGIGAQVISVATTIELLSRFHRSLGCGGWCVGRPRRALTPASFLVQCDRRAPLTLRSMPLGSTSRQTEKAFRRK
jgi:hypothetical protein